MPNPAEILGITGPNAVWKYQYGISGSPGIKELSPADLANGKDVTGYFQATKDGLWVDVRVPVDAGTTGGSTYPRGELRQMTAAGKEAAWDSSKLTCWFEYELVPAHLPDEKPQMCIFQLHSDKKDLLEVIWQRNAVGGFELTQRVDGTAKGQPVIPHDAGRAMTLGFGIVKGVPTVYRDGVAILTTTKMPQSTKTYAKALLYLQSNLTTDAAGQYGEILARNVRSGLGAYPGPVSSPPTDPPPVVVPPVEVPPVVTPIPKAKRTIIMLRHFEKDDNDDGKDDVLHELSVKGNQRCAAFTTAWLAGPPSGLPKPDRCIASKGTSASNRPLKSIQPYQLAAGLPMNTKYDAEKDYKTLGPWLAQRLDVTMVCLEHSAIIDTFKLLGKVTGLPKAWDEKRFDLYWVFTSDDGKNWVLTQIPQMLLAGDKVTPIK